MVFGICHDVGLLLAGVVLFFYSSPRQWAVRTSGLHLKKATTRSRTSHETHGLQMVIYFFVLLIVINCAFSDNIDRIIPACAWSGTKSLEGASPCTTKRLQQTKHGQPVLYASQPSPSTVNLVDFNIEGEKSTRKILKLAKYRSNKEG